MIKLGVYHIPCKWIFGLKIFQMVILYLQHKYGNAEVRPNACCALYGDWAVKFDCPISFFLSPVKPGVINLGVRGRAPFLCYFFKSFFKEYHKLPYYCTPIPYWHTPLFCNFLNRKIYGFSYSFICRIYSFRFGVFS